MPRRHPLLVLLLAVGLAACDRQPESDDGGLGVAAEAEAPAQPDAAVTPPAGEVTGAACLVGTWAVDAPHTFRPETWAGLSPTGGDVPVEFAGTSGRALLTFAPDGASRLVYDDFSITLDSDSPGGEMSTTVTLDGTADARYAVEGNALRFEPGPADLSTHVRASVGGREVSNAELDLESFFASGERGRTTFTCRGDELLLDVHEGPEGGRVLFDDARYTRVSG